MPVRPSRRLPAALLAALLYPACLPAMPFDKLYVFGDSLGDSGNIALSGVTPLVPPVDTSVLPAPVNAFPNRFIPDAPYVRGGGLLPAFTNGAVWGERLAQQLGVPFTPSLALGGAFGNGGNFAFGGARMSPTAGTPPSLVEQVQGFIAGIDSTMGPDAPADALYVLWGGGNDARDAAELAAGGGDPTSIIQAYAANLAANVSELVAEGARHVLVLNVPDIGKTPAVEVGGAMAAAGGTALASLFNDTYAAALDGVEAAFAAIPTLDLMRFDVFSLVQEIVAAPASFGLTDVDNACVVSAACVADPSGHLFWDGIHITDNGHRILANRLISALGVPAPATLLLALPAVMLLLARRR